SSTSIMRPSPCRARRALWDRRPLRGFLLPPLERLGLRLDLLQAGQIVAHIQLTVADLVLVGPVVDLLPQGDQLVVIDPREADAIAWPHQDRVGGEGRVALLGVVDRDGAPDELVA